MQHHSSIICISLADASILANLSVLPSPWSNKQLYPNVEILQVQDDLVLVSASSDTSAFALLLLDISTGSWTYLDPSVSNFTDAILTPASASADASVVLLTCWPFEHSFAQFNVALYGYAALTNGSSPVLLANGVLNNYGPVCGFELLAAPQNRLYVQASGAGPAVLFYLYDAATASWQEAFETNAPGNGDFIYYADFVRNELLLIATEFVAVVDQTSGALTNISSLRLSNGATFLGFYAVPQVNAPRYIIAYTGSPVPASWSNTASPSSLTDSGQYFDNRYTITCNIDTAKCVFSPEFSVGMPFFNVQTALVPSDEMGHGRSGQADHAEVACTNAATQLIGLRRNTHRELVSDLQCFDTSSAHARILAVANLTVSGSVVGLVGAIADSDPTLLFWSSPDFVTFTPCARSMQTGSTSCLGPATSPAGEGLFNFVVAPGTPFLYATTCAFERKQHASAVTLWYWASTRPGSQPIQQASLLVPSVRVSQGDYFMGCRYLRLLAGPPGTLVLLTVDQGSAYTEKSAKDLIIYLYDIASNKFSTPVNLSVALDAVHGSVTYWKGELLYVEAKPGAIVASSHRIDIQTGRVHHHRDYPVSADGGFVIGLSPPVFRPTGQVAFVIAPAGAYDKLKLRTFAESSSSSATSTSMPPLAYTLVTCDIDRGTCADPLNTTVDLASLQLVSWMLE